MSRHNRDQAGGNREAAEKNTQVQRDFIKKGGVERADRDNSEMTAAEREHARRAQRADRKRARETDPGVVRDYDNAPP